MSQIASFYLIKNNQRQELSDGDCSGAVYMAIWDLPLGSGKLQRMAALA